MSIISLKLVCPLMQGDLKFGCSESARSLYPGIEQPPPEFIKLLEPAPISIGTEMALRARDKEHLKDLTNTGFLRLQIGYASEIGGMNPREMGAEVKFYSFIYSNKVHKKPEEFCKAMNWFRKFIQENMGSVFIPGTKLLIYQGHLPSVLGRDLTVKDVMGE